MVTVTVYNMFTLRIVVKLPVEGTWASQRERARDAAREAADKIPNARRFGPVDHITGRCGVPEETDGRPNPDARQHEYQFDAYFKMGGL